jgi:hypothetical protein
MTAQVAMMPDVPYMLRIISAPIVRKKRTIMARNPEPRIIASIGDRPLLGDASV